MSARSFISGALLVERHMLSREIATAVELETEHQAERWGHVEDYHDVEWANIRRQLASAALLILTEPHNYL